MSVRTAIVKATICLLALGVSCVALAVDTPTVLPIGVRSLVLKRGTLSGLNEYYTSSGELTYLSELNSIELDIKNLTRLEPRIQELVSILNNFGTFNLGNQLHLGQLTVDADPEVTYFAPMALLGWNKYLTVGIAVPVIQYKNTIAVTQRGSNLNALRAEFTGTSAELDAAIAQLNRDMTKEFYQNVNEKGYDPISNVDEQFIGDITLVAAYQLPKKEKWTHAAQLHIGLPTGPKPDADSLTDLETFGRWTIRSLFISEYRLRAKTSLLSSLSYQLVLPGDVEKRVPLFAADSLPDSSQKMKLYNNPGDSIAASLGVAWKLTSTVTAAAAYSVERKFEDQYSGALENREQFLEAGTDRQARIGKLEITYSSVQDYLNKKAALPGSLSYELSQIVSGENIENQTKHEVTLSVYF